jgi:hypothetical protein
MGFAVTAGVKPVTLKMNDGGKPTTWRVLVVAIAKAKAPRLLALLDKKAAF